MIVSDVGIINRFPYFKDSDLEIRERNYMRAVASAQLALERWESSGKQGLRIEVQ